MISYYKESIQDGSKQENLARKQNSETLNTLEILILKLLLLIMGSRKTKIKIKIVYEKTG